MLGRGGFGITYLGADLRLKRAVAIKEFFPAGSSRHGNNAIFSGALSRSDYEDAIEKFMQEAQMLARFTHRSIVNVYEVFEEHATAYMVMEFLEGEHLLKRMERRGAPLTEHELIDMSGPIAEALDEVHAAGVLHRDIKPENIMLVGPENATRPVLIDFGAAREFASGIANRHSIVLTPGYAPLEQYGEQARRGAFTDVYAFAATLYHVATGVQPPAATERALGVALRPPTQHNPALSAVFEGALLHGLEMKVDARPASASAFYRQMTTGVPAPNNPAGAGDAPSPPPRLREPAPPPPMPIPPSDGSHYARFSAIVRELGQPGRIDTQRMQCPVCRRAEMFDAATPDATIRCPVCRMARLTSRVSTDPLRCPSCRRRDLRPVDVSGGALGVLMRCPNCRVGSVAMYNAPKVLIVPDLWARCDSCGANFDYHSQADTLTLEDLPQGAQHLPAATVGKTLTRAEWAGMAGSASDACVCPDCNSAFQSCDGSALEWVARHGEAHLVPAEYRGQCLPRSTWARLAHGIAADAGSLACPHCRAEFDEPSSGTLTLLRGTQDPHGVLAAQRGRSLPITSWLAMAAKPSTAYSSGYACPDCSAYLRASGRNAFTLAAHDPANDPHGVGRRYAGKKLADRDWRRIAAGAVPESEDRRLREEARQVLWQALLAGEVATPAAERSFPGRPAPGEKVVVTFGAVTVRSRFGFLYQHDEGQVWLTTAQIGFRGSRGDVIVPLKQASGARLLDLGTGGARAIEIIGHDRRDLLRFYMGHGPLEFTIQGLALQLPWDERRFVELFESLRRRA
jgi:serine/threonine protein kinase